MSTVIARFQVTGFDPSTIPGIEGDWVGALVMRKTFAGEIEGTSVLHFVSSGVEPQQAYLAAERITGRHDGRDGELTVHHWGTQLGETFTNDGVIVPGSGSGPFEGWTGRALIRHDAEGASFEFQLD